MSGAASRPPRPARRPAGRKPRGSAPPRKPRPPRPRLAFIDVLLIAMVVVLALMIAGVLWLALSGGL